jgi:predicted enzyme related to lactoylglutathione lyase
MKNRLVKVYTSITKGILFCDYVKNAAWSKQELKMFKIRPRETVILAVNFSALVDWYRDALGFNVIQLFDDDYHYCHLETESGINIGIADAAEMGVEPTPRAGNTIVLQFEVDNVKEFFAYLNENGGSITGGPSFDDKDKFWFGSFSDPEGNPYWVVDKNCP